MKIVAAMPRLPKLKCLAVSKTVSGIAPIDSTRRFVETSPLAQRGLLAHKGVVLTEENVRSSTFAAEIGGMSSFEHLELVSKNVLLPVLTNQTNQLSWGDLTSREVAGESIQCVPPFMS